jgi:hypothetical protein
MALLGSTWGKRRLKTLTYSRKEELRVESDPQMDRVTIKWWIDRCAMFEEENLKLKEKVEGMMSTIINQECEISRLERNQRY